MTRRSAGGWSSGFRCSEYISTDDAATERITGAWLLRKPTVHDVALTAGTGPRLHHFAYWIAEEPAEVPARVRLKARRRRLSSRTSSSAGPGATACPTPSSSTCATLTGIASSCTRVGDYTGDPDHCPLRWSVNDPRCRSFWGARAPRQLVRRVQPRLLIIGPDGETVATEPAGVDERAQHAEVMA